MLLFPSLFFYGRSLKTQEILANKDVVLFLVFFFFFSISLTCFHKSFFCVFKMPTCLNLFLMDN